jgi:uncharacterized membrane protein
MKATTCFGLICISLVAVKATAQVFIGLQNAPNSVNSYPALSGDGSTVVGKTGNTAMRWRVGTGLEAIPLSQSEGYASDVSHNGSVLAGNFQNSVIGHPAFGYSPSGEFPVPLNTFGVRVSSDGSTIAGSVTTPTGSYKARLYKPLTNTIIDLPSGVVPPGGVYFSPRPIVVTGISQNGQSVVGTASVLIGNPTEDFAPYLWNESTGTRYVTRNDGSRFLGFGADISDNGMVALVGENGVGSSGSPLYLYLGVGLLQPLGFNAVNGSPRLSGSGQTIVSYQTVWQEGVGARPLTTVLTQAGCNFAGGTNLTVTDVNFDGTVLTGNGTHLGVTEAWYAVIPAPGGVVTLVMCGGVMGARRRRVG